jgi:hypothetical protein
MRTTMPPDGLPELAVRKERNGSPMIDAEPMTAIGKRGAYAKQMQ